MEVEFSTEEITKMVRHAMETVFDTMLSTELKLTQHNYYPNEEGTGVPSPEIDTDEVIISSSVGFAGKVNGVMYLVGANSLCELLAGRMLGMEPEEVREEGDEVINDVLGELANMCVGTFKNRICDLGYQCMLTVPTIVRGRDMSIVSNKMDSMSRHIFYFETCGSVLITDLIFQPQDA